MRASALLPLPCHQTSRPTSPLLSTSRRGMAFAIDLGCVNSTISTVVRSGVDIILNEGEQRRHCPEASATALRNWATRTLRAPSARCAGLGQRPRISLSLVGSAQGARWHPLALAGQATAATWRLSCPLPPPFRIRHPSPAASKRQNPTIVSFNGNERFIGEAGVTQVRRLRAGWEVTGRSARVLCGERVYCTADRGARASR